MLLITAWAAASCRTVEMGTGVIIQDSICEWEMHSDDITGVCWVESWHQDHRGDTRLVLPVNCVVLEICRHQKTQTDQ